MTPLRALLWPVSVVFGTFVRMRAWCYRRRLLRQRRLTGVVISVGNLTVGGTGKTPIVIRIAERLVAEGKRTGILTRGYRGGEGTSDEAELLRNRLGDAVKIGVGADRHAAGCKLAREGVDWFVLDDGFQHLRLARDVDIVLIDATDPFGGGHVLPAGRLREPKSALARADLVVITRSERAPAVEAVVRRHSTAPIFYAQTELEAIYRLGRSVAHLRQVLNPQQKVFAFCGIGNPAAFFDDLRRWGLTLVGRAVFRDHHRFSRQDVEEIERSAAAAGADALLCTEKDVFNLADSPFKELPAFYCRISMRLIDEETFWPEIHAAVGRHRTRTPR